MDVRECTLCQQPEQIEAVHSVRRHMARSFAVEALLASFCAASSCHAAQTERDLLELSLEELGKIVGYGKDALRNAGRMPAPGGPAPAPGAVFTRTTRLGGPPDEAGAGIPAEPAEWDEVDRLFLSG